MEITDLHFEIDHSDEKHGGVPCYLTYDGLTHKIHASVNFPPFRGLLDFLRGIWLQRLPCQFFIEEEGFGPYFEAWPLGEDSPDFHLRIVHETLDYHWIDEGEDRRALVDSYQVLWVDADLNRAQVVEIFLTALRDFVLYSKQPELWGISLADLAAFEALRKRSIPPRADIHTAEPVDLILTRHQEEEEFWAANYLELRMWDMSITTWHVDDPDPFWPRWFALLEHALLGQPYQMTFTNTRHLRLMRDLVTDGSVTPAEANRLWTITLRAVPLDHPRHFRLQILETEGRYDDYLLFDEVLDPTQLARVFIKEFEDLLAEGYVLLPDEDGVYFDLRTLPRKRLREAVQG
jgi:hypothetical protein